MAFEMREREEEERRHDPALCLGLKTPVRRSLRDVFFITIIYFYIKEKKTFFRPLLQPTPFPCPPTPKTAGLGALLLLLSSVCR